MKPISFLLFLAMLAFAACQKDSTDPNQPSDPGTALIKTESFNGQVDTYFYDDQHRITKAIFNNHDWRDVEYGDHVFYEKEYKSDSTISYIATYELNADNLIFRYTNTSNPTYEDLRYYDADKHLKKEVSTSNGHTFLIEHYYTDGNLDSTVFHQDNQWLYTYRYTYFTDKANVFSLRCFGEVYQGKESKNLLKAWYSYFPNPENNHINSFSYEFDALGRVIREDEFQNGTLLGTFLETYY